MRNDDKRGNLWIAGVVGCVGVVLNLIVMFAQKGNIDYWVFALSGGTQQAFMDPTLHGIMSFVINGALYGYWTWVMRKFGGK